MPARDVKPKVGITYHFFPHYRGGIVRRLSDSDRFHFLFVSDQQYSDGAIPPHEFSASEDYLRASCRRFGPVYWQPGFIRLALRRDIDAIVSLGNPYFASTWIMAVIARLAGKKVYLWTHGWTHHERLLPRVIRHAYYRLFQHLFLYGTRAFEYGLSQGFSAKQMTVVYNCLDYDLQRKFRETITAGEVSQIRSEIIGEQVHNANPHIICFIGRLTENCRLDLLFDAVSAIDPTHSRFALLIIGDGPARQHLELQAKDRDLPVCFKGAIYDEGQTGLLLMASDFLVSPGKVGLTAMHAMAYGLPVITNSIWHMQMPEYESVVPGLTGEYFDEMTAPSLAAAIERWVGNPASRDETARTCIAEVETRWNPANQSSLIESQLSSDLLSDNARSARPGKS